VVAVRDEDADPVSRTLPDSLTRRVILWTQEFSVAPYLLASTDAILTLPSRAAKLYARHHPLALFTPPVELGGFPYSLTWHERSRRDPAALWLIDQLAAPFTKEPSA
jgi:DNA-binding transcriptional LysR family regulator